MTRWRIASSDLLPGAHRCLRILATEGRHDVDDQSGRSASRGLRERAASIRATILPKTSGSRARQTFLRHICRARSLPSTVSLREGIARFCDRGRVAETHLAQPTSHVGMALGAFVRYASLWSRPACRPRCRAATTPLHGDTLSYDTLATGTQYRLRSTGEKTRSRHRGVAQDAARHRSGHTRQQPPVQPHARPLASRPNGQAGPAARRGYLSGESQQCLVGRAEETGLPAKSASVLYGEAMLTMQTAAQKTSIVAEAARVLRAGGRYGIHELSLKPDDLADSTKAEIQQALSDAIHVGARPLRPANGANCSPHRVSSSRHRSQPRCICSNPGGSFGTRAWRGRCASSGTWPGRRLRGSAAAHPSDARDIPALRRPSGRHRNRCRQGLTGAGPAPNPKQTAPLVRVE